MTILDIDWYSVNGRSAVQHYLSTEVQLLHVWIKACSRIVGPHAVVDPERASSTRSPVMAQLHQMQYCTVLFHSSTPRLHVPPILSPLQIRVIKVQTNALTDQASEAKLTLNSLHNEAQELQDQIVQVSKGGHW